MKNVYIVMLDIIALLALGSALLSVLFGNISHVPYEDFYFKIMALLGISGLALFIKSLLKLK